MPTYLPVSLFKLKPPENPVFRYLCDKRILYNGNPLTGPPVRPVNDYMRVAGLPRAGFIGLDRKDRFGPKSIKFFHMRAREEFTEMTLILSFLLK